MRRPRVRVRPLPGLLLVLVVATTALAWKQSRSNGGSLPLLIRVGGAFTFLYEQDGIATAGGGAATHAIYDAARGTINDVPTSDATANRGADFNLTEPIDDDVDGGVANDSMNRVFAFTTDTNNDIPSGVLAFASAWHNTANGQIAECDIAINAKDHNWSGTNPDLQGVFTHELIHCYGVNHSAVAGIFNSSGHEVLGAFTGDFTQHATMYPFHSGTTNDRTLQQDDIAALSTLYPNAMTNATLGTITGTVKNGSGTPVVGAHVVAVSTSDPNTSVVGFFSDTDNVTATDGSYRLLVPAGNYFVRVEPIIGFPNRFTQANIFHPVTFMSNFPPEFYSGVNESPSDSTPDNALNDAAAVTVMAGQITPGINIIVNNVAAFTNDNFSGRRAISANAFAEAVDVTAATTEGTDPTGNCFRGAPALTAWYSFTAPSSGTATFSTEGSHYDTAVAAFTGSPGAFSQASGACSEDLGTPNFRSNLQSRITFMTTAGTTYHFLVSNSQFVSANPPQFLLVVNFFFQGSPAPSISSISPASLPVGSAGFMLTVFGSGFTGDSVVRWNGADRGTTLISPGQLEATIPASDLINTGAAQITVFNPPPGGGTSNGLTFNLLRPVAAGLLPSIIPATSPQFDLTVNGTNFHSGSVVQWNGMNRATMFFSSTQLKATIPNADLATVGTAQVRVFNSGGFGGISNSLPFTINLRNPLPTITGLSPAGVIVNSGAFSLTVNGSNFVFNSTVRFNGSNRATTFVSGNRLQAAILAGDVTSVGTGLITVSTPGPGGGVSNTLDLAVQAAPNPPPNPTLLAPNSIVAGTVRDALMLQVNGTGASFVPGSVVLWNGMTRATTFNNSDQLTAAIPASDLVSAGTAMVKVFTPGPAGGSSGGLTFTINNPLPATSSLSPASAVAGAPGLTLTVVGSNFVPASVVRWEGADRPTTFIGNSQLRATIPASDLGGAGAAMVSVFTPGPGGGASNNQLFTISASLLTASEQGEVSPVAVSPGRKAAESAGAPVEDFSRAAQAPIPGGVGGYKAAAISEALEPKTAPAGGEELTLKVRGRGFTSGAVVRWNGEDLPTIFVSPTELKAVVPARLAAVAGSVRVTVFLPELGIDSQPKTFAVTPH